MSVKKNIKVAVATLLTAGLLAAAGWFGYDYVNKHYVLLNLEEQATLLQNISAFGQQNYLMGLQACKKSI